MAGVDTNIRLYGGWDSDQVMAVAGKTAPRGTKARRRLRNNGEDSLLGGSDLDRVFEQPSPFDELHALAADGDPA